MKRIIVIFLLTCACLHLHAQVSIITTVAGTDSAGFSGDGGPATDAKLNITEGFCFDNFGNIYIADGLNNRVRKVVISTGIITTIAGSGPAGTGGSFSGDGGPATDATLNLLCAVFTDTAGNLFIADAANNRVRKIVASTGIITTIAGSGPIGVGAGSDTGDGGAATNAQLNVPVGLCLDKHGNIYIGDYSNNKVRKVDAATGIITTIAGIGITGYTGGFVGYSGDGGAATNAVFSGPIQCFADSFDNIFICDQWNHAIRKIDAGTGIITTIAGNGSAGYTGDGGLAIHAQLNQPCGVYVDKQENIFIAEYGDGVIRRIDGITGIITTVAGTGTRGYSGDGGPATDAELKCGDVFLDNTGTVYIADEDNNRIRVVYNPALAVVSSVISKNDVRIFPNPAQDEITIENAAGSDVRIYNLIGQEMASFSKLKMTSNRETMNVQTLTPGIYIIHVISDNGEQQNFSQTFY